MCKTIREAICNSQMLTEMINRGEVKVLALYPDELLDEWHAYREHIPSNWINSYDKGTAHNGFRIYNVTAAGQIDIDVILRNDIHKRAHILNGRKTYHNVIHNN